MKSLRVYDIITEEGVTLASLRNPDIIMSMQHDFEWTDVFIELEKMLGEPIESYSYEVVE
jgi:hypothetical protein